MKTVIIIVSIVGALSFSHLQAQQGNRDPYSELFSIKREEAIKKGTIDATNDIKANKYKVLIYGLRGNPSDKEKELEKLGISHVPIAGCIVSEGILGYAERYNSIMKQFLEKKFGKDIFAGNP